MVVILLEEILQSVLFDLRHRDLPRTAWLQLTWWWNGMTGWHWMTSSERWIWKLLSWRLDILPAKFRSTADTSENLQISIPSIHARRPFSVKAQMLLPVSTLEVFGAAKDVRHFLANNLGEIQQDIQRENNLTKIQNRDKKNVFLESGVKVSAVLIPRFGHPQLQIRWSGTGISTRFALLVSIHANLEHFKGFQWFTNTISDSPKNYKNTKTDNLHIFCSLLQQSSTFQKDSPYSYGLEGFSSPSVPTIRVPFDPWKAGSPKIRLSPHSCHVRSHGWSPSRRWWSESRRWPGTWVFHIPPNVVPFKGVRGTKSDVSKLVSGSLEFFFLFFVCFPFLSEVFFRSPNPEV